MLRNITSLFIPFLFLGSAFYIFPELLELPASQLRILKFFPLGIAVFTLGLCLRFNRSRTFFSLLTLCLTYGILQWYLPYIGDVYAKLVWNLLCVLVPVNLVIFSLLLERGMFTLWGGTRFAVLIVPMIFFVGFIPWFPEQLLTYFTWRFIEEDLFNWVNFSQASIFIMLAAFLILNGKLFAKLNNQNSSQFVVLLASIILLHYWNDDIAIAVFFCSAVLIMSAAVIQESWSMAYIDTLTNLPGRRALDEAMLKLGGRYSIAMLDIDHFKRFNDKYGHDAGDQVLKMAAARIKNSVVGGKVFRFGGEEFTILFSSKETSDVLETLDEVRQSVSECGFQIRRMDRSKGTRNVKNLGKVVNVTISIGVANRTDKMTTPEDVLKGADKALYKAKKSGRNQISK